MPVLATVTRKESQEPPARLFIPFPRQTQGTALHVMELPGEAPSSTHTLCREEHNEAAGKGTPGAENCQAEAGDVGRRQEGYAWDLMYKAGFGGEGTEKIFFIPSPDPSI